MLGVVASSHWSRHLVAGSSCSACSTLWSVVCVNIWRRTEHVTRLKWGVDRVDAEASPAGRDALHRAEFAGELKPSPVDGMPERFFPSHVRARRRCENMVPVSLAVLVSIAGFAAYVQLQLTRGGAAAIRAGDAHRVFIQVMNFTYTTLVARLTARRITRRQEHTDVLVLRMFAFQFVNSYALLYNGVVRPLLATAAARTSPRARRYRAATPASTSWAAPC